MEFKDKQAIYLQIADVFCEKILLNKWEKEARIPSVRETAVEIEVNPNTVMRAYNYLQEQGIIFNKRGIGYFVAEDGLEKTQELKKKVFVDQQVPTFFKSMKMLDLGMEDIKEMYNNFWKNGHSPSMN
ncbi:MAG: GntR family transcriptional regulator [Flammeovirgaceae bacterium]|nr:GntR family transcriptional regulator [Flammeovirgaceae bacterium]